MDPKDFVLGSEYWYAGGLDEGIVRVKVVEIKDKSIKIHNEWKWRSPKIIQARHYDRVREKRWDALREQAKRIQTRADWHFQKCSELNRQASDLMQEASLARYDAESNNIQKKEFQCGPNLESAGTSSPAASTSESDSSS